MTKKEAKAIAQAEKRERRQERWREIRCFWTWPFGHWYIPWQEGDTYDSPHGCAGCGYVRPQF